MVICELHLNFVCISEKSVRLKFNPKVISVREPLGALDMATTVRTLDLDPRGSNMDLDCVETAPATISCICKYQTGTFQVTVVNIYSSKTDRKIICENLNFS